MMLIERPRKGVPGIKRCFYFACGNMAAALGTGALEDKIVQHVIHEALIAICEVPSATDLATAPPRLPSEPSRLAMGRRSTCFSLGLFHVLATT